MKNLIRLGFAATFLILLSACQTTTYWRHSESRDWDGDLYACEQRSTRNVCTTSPATVNTQCFPTGNGGRYCNTQSFPETTSCKDVVNFSARDSCLRSMGWHETSKP
jgi:hypothetical protein